MPTMNVMFFCWIFISFCILLDFFSNTKSTFQFGSTFSILVPVPCILPFVDDWRFELMRDKVMYCIYGIPIHMQTNPDRTFTCYIKNDYIIHFIYYYDWWDMRLLHSVIEFSMKMWTKAIWVINFWTKMINRLSAGIRQDNIYNIFHDKEANENVDSDK